MKKIGLGIAIILFGVLLELPIDYSLVYIDWIIGLIGMIFAISGFMEKDEKK